jgi:hypothetical protein
MNIPLVPFSGDLIHPGAEVAAEDLDTSRLAAAVNTLPDCHSGFFSVKRYPPTFISDEIVDVHLTVDDRIIVIIVGCPVSGPPQVSRIVLWQGGNFCVSLQKRYPNWTPKNSGMTQKHIDDIAAYVGYLAAAMKGGAQPPSDIFQTVRSETAGTLAHHSERQIPRLQHFPQ